MAWQIQPGFMREVNEVLRNLQLPWHCIRPVEPDGDCFFHGVYAQMQMPGMSTHPRALGCRSSQDLRESVVDWARRQPALKDVEGFKVIKNWNKYLEDMRKKGEWADQHIICLTAMFLGKHILLATDTCTKERPWHRIELHEDGPYACPPITLGYLRQRHFEPIVRKSKHHDECLACGWKGASLRGHIARTRKGCKVFYTAQMFEEISGQGQQAQASSEQGHKEVRLPVHLEKISLICTFLISLGFS